MPPLLTSSPVSLSLNTSSVSFSSLIHPWPSHLREDKINSRTVCLTINVWERLDWAQAKVTLRLPCLICALLWRVIVNISALSLEVALNTRFMEKSNGKTLSIKGFSGLVLLNQLFCLGENGLFIYVWKLFSHKWKRVLKCWQCPHMKGSPSALFFWLSCWVA